jgi:hypothetical protein
MEYYTVTGVNNLELNNNMAVPHEPNVAWKKIDTYIAWFHLCKYKTSKTYQCHLEVRIVFTLGRD